MALTKVSRGLLSTGIVDNSNATAITLNADESATFAGAISVTGTATAGSLLTTGAIASTAVDGTVVDRSGNTSRFVAGRSGGNYAALEMHVAGASGVTKRFSIDYDSTTKFFAPNGTSEHLVVTSAGSVGIGVSTAYTGGKLSVNGGIVQPSGAQNVIGLYGTSGLQMIGVTGGDNVIGTMGANEPLVLRTGSAERLRITSAGAVELSGDSGAGQTFLNFTANSNITKAQISGAKAGSNGGTLRFSTNNSSGTLTEAFRITAARDMYFGQTSGSAADVGHIMQSNGVMFHTADGQTGMYLRRLNSDGSILEFRKNSTTIGSINAVSGHMGINAASGTGKLLVGSVVRYNWDANQFYPEQDNARDLGFPSLRWDDVYSTGGINTSDRNEKQDIEELSDAEQRVAVACKGLMRKFRWKSAVIDKGDDARIHVGIMAQDLQAAFESEGLDPARYGMWCSNTWNDEETGEEITRMSVRYNELLAFIISAI